MTRLIDADALKEKIAYRQWDVDDDLSRDEASTRISECYVIDRMVDEMLTVDAVPVRHGKWLPGNGTDAYWVCSCCGFPSEAHGAFKIYKYCPNCGARMVEE